MSTQRTNATPIQSRGHAYAYTESLDRPKVFEKARKRAEEELAAFYGRYSRDKLQKESSIEDQLRNAKAVAGRNGAQISREYKDEGITGAISLRPGYQAMMRDAEKGLFRILVVDDLSRLGRDSDEANRCVKRLKFLKVRILTSQEGYDSAAKSEKVTRFVRNFFNEMQLDDISHKVKRGLHGVALKGYWTGSRPYGYKLEADIDPNKEDAFGNHERLGSWLVVHTPQAAIIVRIFTRYVEGASWRVIARELNDDKNISPDQLPRNRRTRRDLKIRRQTWRYTTIRDILRNPLYTGRVVYGRSEWVRNPDTQKMKRVFKPREEWIERTDEALRIIPDDLFAKAQKRTIDSATNTTNRSGGRSRHILSGLLECAHCGYNLTLNSVEYYWCNGHAGHKGCPHKEIVSRETLEKLLIKDTLSELLADDRVKRMAEKIEQGIADAVRKAKAEKPKLSSEMRKAVERIRDLERWIENGHAKLSSAALQAALAVERASLDELQGKAERIEGPSLSAREVTRGAQLFKQRVTQCLRGDPETVAKARGMFRRLFCGKVRIEHKCGKTFAHFHVAPDALLSEKNGSTDHDESHPQYVTTRAFPITIRIK